MTEAEWLACEDPARMLAYLGGVTSSVYGYPPERERLPSDRKLRLFACACCRALWSFMGERDRAAIAMAEKWADGEDVHADLYDLIYESQGMVRLLHWADATLVARSVIDSARQHNTAILPAYASILRDIIGNPFRPVADPWQGPMALAEPILAEAIHSIAGGAYDELREGGSLDSARLSVLADALEEAGREPPRCVHCVNGVWGEYEDGRPICCNCCHSDLLRHLRSPGPHYRGCWAVDLVLGQE